MLMRVQKDHGFAMFTVVGVMMVIAVASVAAFAAVDGDRTGTARNVDDKSAYAAAEAGLQAYAYQLSVDADLWSYCASPPASTGISMGTWVAIPGTVATKVPAYRLEIIAANGYGSCVPGFNDSVIDRQTGTMRIRATGRAYAGGPEVQLIGTHRKPTFSEYAYFSDSEGGLSFGTGDSIRGPMHTNDAFRICGSPEFGLNPSHNIEAVSPGSSGNGWTSICGGFNPQVNFPPATTYANRGTWRHPASTVQMPSTNAALLTDTLPAYRFQGQTNMEFYSNATFRVRGNQYGGGYVDQVMPMPSNGLIYVANGACPRTYDYNHPYASSYDGVGRCGIAYVEGRYSRNITIASESDVVFDDNFLRSGDAVAGVIANNYVRIYRPIFGTFEQNCPFTRESGITFAVGPHPWAPRSISIDAAILALNYSFTVDNYWCWEYPFWETRDVVTVTGSIAQKTRNRVGSSSGTGTGYDKVYRYDTRMRFRSPPSYLDPPNAAWRLLSVQQQVN